MSLLDKDIVTDAVADPPRPSRAHIPEPPKPEKPSLGADAEPLSDEDEPSSQPSFTQSSKSDFGYKKGYKYSIKNCNGFHMGNIINIGLPNAFNTGPSPSYDDEVPPKEFRGLMSSTKHATQDHLDTVAGKVGDNWRKLGRLLDMTEADLDRLKNDNPSDHYETVYQMLREWSQATGGPNQAALLSHLSSVLWQLRERDALAALVEVESDPRRTEKTAP